MSLVSWAPSSSAAPSVSNLSRFSRSARPAVGALNKIEVFFAESPNYSFHLNFDFAATRFAVFRELRGTA